MSRQSGILVRLTLILSALPALAGCLALLGFAANPCAYPAWSPVILDEQQRSFDGTLAGWRDAGADGGCGVQVWARAVAECGADGTLVLWEDGPFHSALRFYDPSTRALIGFREQGDVIDPSCGGEYYWPQRMACEDGRLLEVLCDTRIAPGQSLADYLGLADATSNG